MDELRPAPARSVLIPTATAKTIEVDGRIYAEAQVMAGKLDSLTGALALAIAVQGALALERYDVHLVEDEGNGAVWAFIDRAQTSDDPISIVWYRLSESAIDWLDEERGARVNRLAVPPYSGSVDAEPRARGRIESEGPLASLGFARAIPDLPERKEKGQLSLFEL